MEPIAKRPKKQKGGKKNRKFGRDKIKCERYRRERRREKNKVKKVCKHLKKHPNDFKSKDWYNNFINL
jgi:hypothetical protein